MREGGPALGEPAAVGFVRSVRLKADHSPFRRTTVVRLKPDTTYDARRTTRDGGGDPDLAAAPRPAASVYRSAWADCRRRQPVLIPQSFRTTSRKSDRKYAARLRGRATRRCRTGRTPPGCPASG